MLAVQNAVVRLLKSRPFYGHLLLGLRRRVATTGLGITINNGIPTLVVAPDEFVTFTPAEQEALLEHLLKHLLHLHPLRAKDRHSGTWDLCCDLAINPTITGLPPGAVLPGRFRLPAGWAAEEYYRELHLPFDTGNLEGSGHGNAAEDLGDPQRKGERGDDADSRPQRRDRRSSALERIREHAAAPRRRGGAAPR